MRKPPPLNAAVLFRLRKAEAAALDAACAIMDENRSVFARRVVFDEVRRVIEEAHATLDEAAGE